MKTSYQQFRENLIKEGYKFIRTSKKPFGQRIVAHKGGKWSEKRVLVYDHSIKVPNLTSFSSFLRDFERFIKTYESNYDVKNGFFLVSKNCPQKLVQQLKTILKTSSEDLRKKVKVVQLEN
jgi:hypothetical protein